MVIALLGVLLVAGCIQTQQQETIKIGLLSPLSGEAASWGQNVLAASTLAVEEINAKGGINGKKIELIAEDDKCTSESVKAINKLINIDRVVGIVGPVCSAAAGPALPIARDNDIPVIIIASAPGLTKIGDNIFRVYPSDAIQGKVGAEFIYDELEKKKAALIYVQNDWGENIKEVFKERFIELGGEIVYEGGVKQTETDFKTELVKVKESDAEALYFPVYMTNGISAFKQMKETDFNLPVIGGDAFDGEEVVKSEYSDDILYTVSKVNIPEDFKEKLKSLSGFENLQVSMIAPFGYDATKVMLSAIEKAGVDKEAIKEALAETSYEGVSSPIIEFDKNGDLKKAVFEIKIIKNKQAIAYEG